MIPTSQQAAAELARRSLTDFARVVQPALSLTPFHRAYYRVLELFARGEIRRLIVTIPPQHGKSTGSSILLPAYRLGIRPGTKIALACYNVRLASRFNRRIQQTMDSAAYRSIFPQSRLKQSGGRQHGIVRTGTEFELAGQRGSLLCVGRDGPLTGNPVDLFILDDLYKNALEANSPLVRDHVWEWYNAVVKTRLHNDSQELIVFTRWHADDLIGRLAERETVTPLDDLSRIVPQSGAEGWYLLNFEAVKQGPPNGADPRRAGEALWPERHALPLLEQKRRLDTLLFEAMYQGRPALREGLLYGDGFATYDALPDDTVKKGNYTDTADTGDDYLCSICYETGRDGAIYVTDAVYTPLDMEQTEPAVARMLQRNGTRTARIESNNGGRGFARSVARLCPGIRIEWFHQSANKEARILTNAPTVLSRILFPADWTVRWSELHHDLATFRHRLRDNLRDDAPDALTGIVETGSDAGHKNIRAVRFRQ